MRLFRLLTLVPFLIALQASAQDRPVVIEMYTSQGCSSCPPADAFFSTLATRPDVIALALHVDYWDYLGWKDKFASPAFSARQRSYAAAEGKQVVYTPQMIVDGQTRVLGNRPKDVEALIRRQGAQARQVSVEVRRSGADLSISALALVPMDTTLSVQLVRYLPQRVIEITHGENAGRTVTYANIVTDWTELARWDAAAPLHLGAAVPGDAAVAVIVQRPGHGEIVGAALAD